MMNYLILYIFLYCNIDIILHKFYFSKYDIAINNELIQNNENFYYSMINLNTFALFIYITYTIKNILYYNSIHKYSVALALVYIKYILNSILNHNITLCQYEYNRNIMWLFATPLMIKMYCEVNSIKLQDINIHYHIIPVLINIFIYPYKYTPIYYYFTGLSWILIVLFIKTLYNNKQKIFTNVYLFIWFIFTIITFADLLQITSSYNINLYYLAADISTKITTNIIINDYHEREKALQQNMDLQSIQFVSYILNKIQKYKESNAIITPQCIEFINFTSQRFLLKVPDDKTALEQELLKKILPFDLEKEYIANANENTNANAGVKQFNMICILFIDIVNYTELAHKFNNKIIFDLLYSIYNKFDNIIKKYPHLQKIETIGDAYMVVGDIFRNTINHKVVIKEILLYALDVIKEIKLIHTPDNNPLFVRVGINMGSVSVGILGNELPRLCIVGSAVNIASRLQSTSEVDTIQMSHHIYEQLEEIEFDVKLNIVKKIMFF